jgi:DNA-binding MarR family transcriptional regulator
VVHQPVRFSILAALSAATEAEFGFVRDTVQVTDSTLSKQVAVLEQAGFVQVKKGYVGKRPRTWLRITPAGRSAFSDHLETLRQIAGHATGTPPP